MKTIYDIIRKPLVTEKSLDLKEHRNQIVFEVRKDAKKREIQEAVETIFKVKVEGVRTLHVSGKKKRLGRSFGERPDWKKAVVTLRAGDRIEVLDQV